MLGWFEWLCVFALAASFELILGLVLALALAAQGGHLVATRLRALLPRSNP